MLDNPSDMMLENPSLLPNQITGAFTRANLMAYGTAAAGVAVGLLVADFVDRYVATRKPADSTPTAGTAQNAWYGRDAAAAQRMRPDAWRLATQAGGAVVALGLAYWTRGQRIIPWLLGGTAIGFGANLLKMLADWWLMPALFKAEPTEVKFGNRMYPLEQSGIQDQVADIFKNWAATDSLNAGQQPNLTATLSPFTGPTPDVYTLGRANQAVSGNGRFFKNTGRLGNCPSCGGYNGCWNDCDTQCPDCPGYNPHKKCTYVLQTGDDLYAIASQGGVSINDVVAMNPGVAWPPPVGTSVTLPYGMCAMLQNRAPGVPIPPPGYATTPPGAVMPIPGVGPGAAITPPAAAPAMAPVMTGLYGAPPNGNGNGHANSTPVIDRESDLRRFGTADS